MGECFICKYPEVEIPIPQYDCFRYDCPFCGKYILDGSLALSLPHGVNVIENGKLLWNISAAEFYEKAPTIAAERKLKGMDEYALVDDHDVECWQTSDLKKYVPIGIKAFLSEYPQDAIDMFNRSLLNLGRLIKHPTQKYTINKKEKSAYPYFFSSSFISAGNFCKQLELLGWIDILNNGAEDVEICLTPKGWLAIRELRQSSQDSDKAFLAMWFDPDTSNFRESVKRAVEAAGYIVEVVDEMPHNDFIMNKVINMITDAKFVVADFTCLPEEAMTNGRVPGGVRGGVYFEAGLARGQKKEVIHTCKDTKEAKSRLHFDIHQINTIFWNEDGNGTLKSYDVDFIDVLKHRIIATVGKGKHYKEQ